MKSHSLGWGLFGLALLAALTSCAATGGDVDTTPTLRTSVDAHIGKNFTPDSTRVGELSSNFATGETVFAVVDVPGKIEGSLRVRWMRGGETVLEQTVPILDGVNAYRFRLEPPVGGLPPGDYTFEVWLGDNRAEAESFKIS